MTDVGGLDFMQLIDSNIWQNLQVFDVDHGYNHDAIDCRGLQFLTLHCKSLTSFVFETSTQMEVDITETNFIHLLQQNRNMNTLQNQHQ